MRMKGGVLGLATLSQRTKSIGYGYKSIGCKSMSALRRLAVSRCFICRPRPTELIYDDMDKGAEELLAYVHTRRYLMIVLG